MDEIKVIDNEIIATPADLRRDADLADSREDTPLGRGLHAGAVEMRLIADRLDREREFTMVREIRVRYRSPDEAR